MQFCRYQSIQVQYIIALEMSILERVEYRLPPCPMTTCEDFLEVVLWNAKATLLDTPDSRDRHAARAGNTANKLVQDCELISNHLIRNLLKLCYLGGSSTTLLAVDTGGLLLRCAGVLTLAAMLISDQSEILVNAIAGATDIEQARLVKFAQALHENSKL